MPKIAIIEIDDPPSSAVPGALIVLAGLLYGIYSFVDGYQSLPKPYYYFGWFFYHILFIPIVFIFKLGGSVYDFINGGVTPWPNLNFVLAVLTSAIYWLAAGILGFFSLYVYVPLLICSGLLMAVWAALAWLFR